MLITLATTELPVATGMGERPERECVLDAAAGHGFEVDTLAVCPSRRR